ncbi:MAG TPA: hypothetical protein VGP90_11630 [Acidimicrobiia bacterium]|nr:hypothetical protein [Acidimicrobiia bacterium]
MDPDPEAPGGEEDEVARQRRKHRAAILSRPVPGSPTTTLGQLADEALAAPTLTDEPDGVARFLAAGGHSQATIEKILNCLDLPTPGSGSGDALCGPMDASPGQDRLRTVAHLEALLRKD